MSNTHTKRFIIQKLSAVILGLLLSNSLLLPTTALDLGNGRTFFERSPLLIRSATSFRGPQARVYYYFTIAIPADAGEALQTVTIVQQPNIEKIVAYPDKTSAFLGDRSDDDQQVPITSVTGQLSDENGVKIIFAQPIQPGKTVTIALRVLNPLYGGIYQFGITAYPSGENSQGLYLGSGRIQLSSPGGRGI